MRFKGLLLTLIPMGCMFTGSAFASKDIPYPSSASAIVNSGSAAVTNNFFVGANGSTTLDADVHAGDGIMVTATWSIQDRSADPGQDTIYGLGKILSFTAATNAKPLGAADVVVGAISNCLVTSAVSTCVTNISFAAPATVGDYQIKISVGGTGTTGSNGLTDTAYYCVNFTVAASVEKIDTKLTVAPKCYILNETNVDLAVMLEELSSSTPISGAEINFYVDPEFDENGLPTASSFPIGTAMTDDTGVATLTLNLAGLGVGDHNLYAQFGGDDRYSSSNDSDMLGVTYRFAGFQKPIDAGLISISGGRVIPIKIRLVDASGVPVADAALAVWLTNYDKDLGFGKELKQVSSVSAADTGNIMRYVPEDQQYIYNWDAMGLVNGTYAVVVDLGENSTCRPQNPYAIITVAKKGKK